jgi:hypothetical protein
VVWKAINYRKALLQVTDLKAYRDDLLDECFKILEKGQTSMKIAVGIYYIISCKRI